jgi:hypothetical protein
VVALAALGVAIVGVLLVVQARSMHAGLGEAARHVGEDPLTDDQPFATSPDQEPAPRR